MKKQSFIILLIFSLIPVTMVLAQGGTPGTFLNYAASPRTLALGKAFTGLADDAEAVYFNPGGLALLRTQDIKLSHSSLYGGMRMEYLGYALPTKQFGTFALSLLNYGAENLEVRDEHNDLYQPAFFAQNAYIFSYAFSPTRILGIGANFKVVTENLARFSDVGLGADLGIIVTEPRPFNFGIFAQNLLAPKIQLETESEKFPITLRFGGALRLFDDRVIVVGDAVADELVWNSGTFDYNRIRPHVGLEFELWPGFLTHRIGYDLNELSFGLGLQREWGKLALGIDYAFLLHHESKFYLPPTHKLGLVVKFGGFRTWIDASPRVFSPTPEDRRNVLWMDLRIVSRRAVKRWQVMLKNNLGEVVRTYSGWEMPPLRLAWDGLDDAGRMVSDGKYNYEIIIVDAQEEALKFAGSLTTIKTKGPEGKIEVERESSR